MSAVTAGLMAFAKRAIEGELPEDEPDFTPDWVYRQLLEIGVDAGREIERNEQQKATITQRRRAKGERA